MWTESSMQSPAWPFSIFFLSAAWNSDRTHPSPISGKYFNAKIKLFKFKNKSCGNNKINVFLFLCTICNYTNIFLFSYETFEASAELQPVFLLCIKEPYIYDYYYHLFNTSDYTFREMAQSDPQYYFIFSQVIPYDTKSQKTNTLKVYI